MTEAGIPSVYGYDALNELTSAQTGILKMSWTYDAVGNRLTASLPRGAVKYSYDASDRMLTAGTRTYTYDADGNASSVADSLTHLKWTYTFNAANRLVSVASAGLTNSFVSDGDGNRVGQSVGGAQQNYVNDIGAALPVVLQDAYNVGASSDYVYGLNLIESLQGRDDDFYQYDGLGSVIQLTDAAGRPEWSYLYDPWGNSILPAPPTNPFMFTGQAFDAGSGLYYLRARYYDANSGRFMTRDQFEGMRSVPLTLDKYTYSLNNPQLYTDPSGFSAADSGQGNSVLLTASISSTVGDNLGAIIQSLAKTAVGSVVNFGSTILGLIQAKTQQQQMQAAINIPDLARRAANYYEAGGGAFTATQAIRTALSDQNYGFSGLSSSQLEQVEAQFNQDLKNDGWAPASF